jgi:hypothetical protein
VNGDGKPTGRHFDAFSTLSTYTEREQAVLKNRIERWAFAQPLESGPRSRLGRPGNRRAVLDEAQNMKNPWPYLWGDGGKPEVPGCD